MKVGDTYAESPYPEAEARYGRVRPRSGCVSAGAWTLTWFLLTLAATAYLTFLYTGVGINEYQNLSPLMLLERVATADRQPPPWYAYAAVLPVILLPLGLLVRRIRRPDPMAGWPCPQCGGTDTRCSREETYRYICDTCRVIWTTDIAVPTSSSTDHAHHHDHTIHHHDF